MTTGSVDHGRVFPISALVGADDLRQALLLGALDRRIGGVLLRGDKGSAKSTAARGLASILQGGAPFVELPLGATEDRVVGSFDVRAALGTGDYRYRPGLLEAADGGVLYVDEVNLLPDHLVDLLLDAAASGVVRVERDGLSETRAARFVLVGSMNPEEGELRPQLLDRFGLAVEVRAPVDAAQRAEAVRRRLAFDADPEAFCAQWATEEHALAERLAGARLGRLPVALGEEVATLCAAAGAEGLRADLVMCRAACALAGWEGRDEATSEDVRAVAPLALVHRRRTPWEPFELPPPERPASSTPPTSGAPDAQAAHEANDAGRPDGPGRDGRDDPGVGEQAAGEQAAGEQAAGEQGDDAPSQAPDQHDAGQSGRPPPTPPDAGTELSAGAWSRRRRQEKPEEAPRGRLIGSRIPADPGGPVAVHAGATVLAAAVRRDAAGPLRLVEEDLREPVRHLAPSTLVVLVVDASGSMGAQARLDAARAAVLTLLVDAYQRRDRVALVTFRGEGAVTALRPTGSTEIARARLSSLPTGGRTPLAAGITHGLALATSRRHTGDRPLLVIVSDGRATWAAQGADPVAAALEAAGHVKVAGVRALVVDVETGNRRLGVAGQLADAMGARHVTVGDLSSDALAAAVRASLD